MTTHHHPLELSHQALKPLKIKVKIMVTIMIMARIKGEHKVKKLKEKHLKLKEMMMVDDALGDPDWVMAIQEELNNFTRNEVWELVPRPKQNVIGTKWVFRNKQDEYGIVTRNKARLVAQGFTQIEGSDFGETDALNSQEIREHRRYMDEELLKFERRQKEIMAKVDLPYSPVREPRDFPTPPRVYNPWDDYVPQENPDDDVELDYGGQEMPSTADDEEEEAGDDEETESDGDGDGDGDDDDDK
ncbi:uncharacterized protein LOC120667995 [Panicum virgatum]|uniref:uncharacterized protein LOC120667995 n=1 Tax=Panicum virgatum TaxID=38727 RepID=UPI0019D542F6|nr:uncharacterized protein LOC120667995 [Panicum virgatum]